MAWIPLPSTLSVIGSRATRYFIPNCLEGSSSYASVFARFFGTCDSSCGSNGASDVRIGMTMVESSGGGGGGGGGAWMAAAMARSVVNMVAGLLGCWVAWLPGCQVAELPSCRHRWR